MLKRLSVLVVFGMLTSSCVKRNVIPDPTVIHQVAEESCITIWVRGSDGKKVKQKVRLLEGWWIAGPPVVDPL
jgi:hypothetical protein